jgi:transposase
LKPGDIVVLENLGSHKGQVARAAIRAAGARLFFLPPYSSKAAERAAEAAWRRIGGLSAITSHPKNANDTSQMQVMVLHKRIML